jgi:hypothetical protein
VAPDAWLKGSVPLAGKTTQALSFTREPPRADATVQLGDGWFRFDAGTEFQGGVRLFDVLMANHLKPSNLFFVAGQKPEVGIAFAATLATASLAAAPCAFTFLADSSLISATTKVTTTAPTPPPPPSPPPPSLPPPQRVSAM